MRIDLFTIFPEYLDGPLERVAAGQGPRARPARRARARPARLDRRPPPHRRRHAVRRRRGHGDDAGADLRRGRGRRAAAAAVPPVAAAGPALRPARGRGAGRRRRASRCICGRYEGVDQRVADHLCDGELSVGDYVLAGRRGRGAGGGRGGGPAGARGHGQRRRRATQESFADGLLEYPQYTRPAEFRGWAVPEVLRSGDHARIARWRRREALRRTLERRPDLLDRPLTDDEQRLLDDE